MVGGTRFHRRIHEASLGRNAGKRKDSFREEEKKRAHAARTVYVSRDRADAIIEGCHARFRAGGHKTPTQARCSAPTVCETTRWRVGQAFDSAARFFPRVPHPCRLGCASVGILP